MILRDFLELSEVILKSFWLGYIYKILSIELSVGPIQRIQNPFKSSLVEIGPQQRRRFRDLQGWSCRFGRCARDVRITHTHTHTSASHKEKTLIAQGCSNLHKCCMNMLHFYELSCRLAMSAANAESAHHWPGRKHKSHTCASVANQPWLPKWWICKDFNLCSINPQSSVNNVCNDC